LLARYLQQQADAHQEGLGFAELAGEVVPYEAVPAQPVDPRLASDGALAVLRCYQPTAETRAWTAPPDWPALVASHEPEVALAFAAGNFPQLVRNLHPLLQAADLTTLRMAGGRATSAPALVEWAEQTARKAQYPQLLFAVGALRLARQFDHAAELLARHQPNVPAEWRPALDNETAALAWHRGQADEAVALWSSQPESPPVLFNRGMAALFQGRPADARPLLTSAVRQLPEDGAWHHLGRLYLALAEMRG
jgi:hypothetical protein